MFDVTVFATLTKFDEWVQAVSKKRHNGMKENPLSPQNEVVGKLKTNQVSYFSWVRPGL